jgi:hypothetical protein
MKQTISLLTILTSTLTFSVININFTTQIADAGECRNLKKGDSYYPEYTKCCDIKGDRSLWTNRYGITSNWGGSCLWWLGH